MGETFFDKEGPFSETWRMYDRSVMLMSGGSGHQDALIFSACPQCPLRLASAHDHMHALWIGFLHDIQLSLHANLLVQCVIE